MAVRKNIRSLNGHILRRALTPETKDQNGNYIKFGNEEIDTNPNSHELQSARTKMDFLIMIL